MAAMIDFDPYTATSIDQIIVAWFSFVFVMNGVNRAMGNRDLYPFVLSLAVIGKLEFMHKLVHGQV